MLSTDSIRNKILEDARKSATQILSDADVRAQKNRAASDKRIADARAKAMSCFCPVDKRLPPSPTCVS